MCGAAPAIAAAASCACLAAALSAVVAQWNVVLMLTEVGFTHEVLNNLTTAPNKTANFLAFGGDCLNKLYLILMLKYKF